MSSAANTNSLENFQGRGLGKALPTSYATYVDRWAIVVGISKYQDESLNLKYADRDAEALYELLLTPSGGGFEKDHIVKLVNEEATTAKITRALRSFLKKPAKDDIVLIYFACHGAPDPERLEIAYLLTHDTDRMDISGTALPMREIDLSLDRKNLHAEKVIVLADTCHSGKIGGGMGNRSADNAGVVNTYLQEASQARGGIALLTSSAASEVSSEGAEWGEGHGVFTYYLLKGMQGAADYRPCNGIVTVGELFEYVRENVERATNDKQHPCIGTNDYDRNLPVAITAGISAQEHYELGCQLYQMGMELHDRGRLRSAARHLQEAIRLARITGINFTEAQLKLGLVLMNTDDLEKAIKVFEAAAKVNVPDAAYYLGIAYAKQEESKKSVEVFEAFLQQHPQDKKTSWIQEFILQESRQYVGVKYALLIGVDKYPSESGFDPLNGSLNDVQLVNNLLITQFSFLPENICVLPDSDATYGRILLELQQLARKSTPNDTVVVHFSGHSVEQAKYKSYLVVYDSITSFHASVCGDKQDSANENSFVNTITAQQLHDCLNSISGNKTLILDTHANPNFITLAERGNYTLLLATLPGLSAYERRVDGKRYGFFTYSLVEQLQLVGNAKLLQLKRLVTDRIQSLGGKQRPIVIANSHEYFLASHNYLLDGFNFSQCHNYSAFKEEFLERQYVTSLKQLTIPFPEFYQSLGQALLKKENYEKAISSFQIALEQSQPDHLGILLELGTAHALSRQYTDASKTFQQYLKLDSSQKHSVQIQIILSELEQLISPKRYALLVGIDHYYDSSVPKLDGAENDVCAFEEVLVGKHHFQEENINVLLNRDATCENILRCFKDLVATSEGTPALFYYAGNGSLNNDGSLTILGVDSRQDGIYDIELKELASIVGNRSTNLITIIDAGWANAIECPHGGRVAPPDSRSLPITRPGTRALKSTTYPGAHALKIASELPSDDLTNVRNLSKINYKIGYASIYSESIKYGLHNTDSKIQGESVDSEKKEKTHGILTSALLESLRLRESDTLTYSKLVELISEKIGSQLYVVGTDLTTRIFEDFPRKRTIDANLKQIKQEPLRQTVLTLKRLIEQRNGFDPDGTLSLGVIQYILNEPKESLNTLRSALGQVSGQHSKITNQPNPDQDCSEIHYWLGRMLYENSDSAHAVSELRLATDQDPANAAAYYYLGQALRSLMKQELVAEAEKAFHTYLDFGAPLGYQQELQELWKERNSQEIQ
jgi:uncharacterized caspase-like protein/Flp pilus assembly protein TadD